MEIIFYYISSDRGGFFLWKKTKFKFITEVVSTIQYIKTLKKNYSYSPTLPYL